MEAKVRLRLAAETWRPALADVPHVLRHASSRFHCSRSCRSLGMDIPTFILRPRRDAGTRRFHILKLREGCAGRLHLWRMRGFQHQSCDLQRSGETGGGQHQLMMVRARQMSACHCLVSLRRSQSCRLSASSRSVTRFLIPRPRRDCMIICEHKKERENAGSERDVQPLTVGPSNGVSAVHIVECSHGPTAFSSFAGVHVLSTQSYSRTIAYIRSRPRLSAVS